MEVTRNFYIGDKVRTEAQSEPFVTYRTLIFYCGKFESPFIYKTWNPGEIHKAECVLTKDKLLRRLFFGHLSPVPHQNCHCGLYGYIEPKIAPGAINGFIVITQNWGRTQIHDTGVRSEYCKLIGIVVPDHYKMSVRELLAEAGVKKEIYSWSGALQDYIYDREPLYKEAAKLYNLPLVRKENLPGFVEEYGKPLCKNKVKEWREKSTKEFLKKTRFALLKVLIASILYLYLATSGAFSDLYINESSLMVICGSIIGIATYCTLAFIMIQNWRLVKRRKEIKLEYA